MQISEKIKPLTFKNDYTGKILSISKRTYTWRFEHLDHTHDFKLTIYLMSQKFTVELDDKFTDHGYRPLVEKFKYEVNVHDLNLRILEALHTFDLYINNQKFVPGSAITVVDNTRTNYLKRMTEASSENSNADSTHSCPGSKVIFGTEELIEADKILRSNTETHTQNLTGYQMGSHEELGGQGRHRVNGSRSPPNKHKRAGSRDFLKSPLNQKIVIAKPPNERSLPPLPPLPPRVVTNTSDFFNSKVDSWFFDVSVTPGAPRPIADLKGTLTIGPIHEYENRMEIFLPVGLEDPPSEVQAVIRDIYLIN